MDLIHRAERDEDSLSHKDARMSQFPGRDKSQNLSTATRILEERAVTMEDEVVPLRRRDGEEVEDRVSTAAFTLVRKETGAVSGIFHFLSEPRLRPTARRFCRA